LNRELAQLLLLRAVLGSVSSGMGVSASIVKTFKAGGRAERDAARKVLLGNPPSVALAGISSDKGTELAMLASLIGTASTGNVKSIGKKGEALSAVLEGWLKARESRLLERRVMQARGYIMCAVLGAVMGIVTALGPVVGGLSILQGNLPSTSPYLNYASGAMVAFSSSALGIFLGGKRFYLNLLIAIGVFLLAMSAAAPLTVFPTTTPWAIK
jgi:hypothetical protein